MDTLNNQNEVGTHFSKLTSTRLNQEDMESLMKWENFSKHASARLNQEDMESLNI